jgi:hypothetical protein
MAATALTRTTRGDVFELSGGGAVRGVSEESDAKSYVVRTDDGVLVTISRNEVARVIREGEFAQEYRRRSRQAADDPASHRELAAWCKDHGLAAEARTHMRRLLELAPDDEAARRSLGYVKRGQTWLSQDELMAHRGLQLFDGKYRTAQDVAIRKRNHAADAAEIDWLANLRLWKEWLRSDRTGRSEEAQARIAAIVDPSAVPALVKLLSAEDDPWTFDLLLDALGRLDHPDAVRTLVRLSLDDVAPEVREKCLDYLTDRESPVSIVPYVQALKDRDNRVVNRAGEALGRLGDVAAISPLIDALVTRHTYRIQPGNSNEFNASFNPNGGGGGFSFGGNGPKDVDRDRENPRVLQALNKLASPQGFEYDEQAWRRWYVDQQLHEHVNARRDE